MKFGINQQRVLFGMLFGALALNAAWFQQLSTESKITNMSSETTCDVTKGNNCERKKFLEITQNGKKTETKEITFTYRLTPKRIPGYTNILTKETVPEQEGVAIEIARNDCRGCTETLPTAYTLEEAQRMGISLVKIAQDRIDELAEREAKNMEKKVEIEKKNKEEEKKQAKLEKDREACRIGGDDDKKLTGFEVVSCLAEKIPGMEDDAKRAAAFARLQPQLRDMLISGTEADKVNARNLLAQMASTENGAEVSQTARAMLAGDRFEGQAEGVISQLAGIQRKMGSVRRRSAAYATLLTQKSKLESKLKTISASVSNDLEAAAERAGTKASPASVAEANFWVERLNDNMAVALRDPRTALSTLQGRDTLGGRVGSIASGDLDTLDAEERRRAGSRNGRFDEGRGAGTYSSQPPRGSARQYSSRGQVNGRRGPVYAQGQYNGRGDYDYMEDDGSFLDYPDSYAGGYNGSYNRGSQYNSGYNGRYNGGFQQQRGVRRRF